MVTIDGEGVIYDPAAERVHVLNSTAALVWQLLDGRSSLADLASTIAVASGEEERVVLRGILELVAGLAREGLLEPAGQAVD
jgi:hypothetical protein